MEFVREHPRGKALNLTPLIDVVFLLIIFFMLTSHFRQYEALELALPVGAVTVAPESSPLTLLVGAGGKIILDQETLHIDTLRERLPALLQGDGARPVVIMSTNDVTVQEVVSVVDSVTQAGGTQVSLSHWRY